MARLLLLVDMIKSVFETAELPVAARARAWEAALGGFAVQSSLLAPSPAFRGRIDSYVSDSGLAFSLLESSAQQMRPEQGRVEDVYWLTMVLEGRSTLKFGSPEPMQLLPGDILFGKRGAPGMLELDTPFRLLMVNLPGELLSRHSLLPLPERVVHLSGSRGIGRVLAAMLAAVAESVDELDEAQASAIQAVLPQLLMTGLFNQAGVAPLGGSATRRASLLRAIWHSIEGRLGDADLSIAQVAAEHRLAVRYLQRLFEDNGRSFGEYVRHRRLERCRESMADPLNANVSITTICLHWGFNDSATFSRAFRHAYDMAPRDYRREALQGSAARTRLEGLQFNPLEPARAPRRQSGLAS